MSEQQPSGLFYKIEEMMHNNPGMGWDEAARQVTSADKARQTDQWGVIKEGSEGGSSAQEQQVSDRYKSADTTAATRAFKGTGPSRLSGLGTPGEAKSGS
jgi:hypothetical protein